jgi:hypothetical protein
MVGMADDDGEETDITDLVIDEHGDIRHRIVALWNVRTSGDEGAVALDAAWQPIANLLDGHTGVDATAGHPLLLNQENDETPK